MTNLRHHLLFAITLTVCASSTGAGHTTTAPDRFNHDQNAAEAPSRVVWDILVDGNRLVPTDDVLKLIKTKRGDKFDRDKVIQDLKSINGLGYFDEQGLMCTQSWKVMVLS
jgi:outer membrane protein assembly factor BamA